MFLLIVTTEIKVITSINQSKTVIKYNVGLSILQKKRRMTLDDPIEPESKFVSVQQCQRPIYDCKINAFYSNLNKNLAKLIISFL